MKIDSRTLWFGLSGCSRSSYWAVTWKGRHTTSCGTNWRQRFIFTAIRLWSEHAEDATILRNLFPLLWGTWVWHHTVVEAAVAFCASTFVTVFTGPRHVEENPGSRPYQKGGAGQRWSWRPGNLHHSKKSQLFFLRVAVTASQSLIQHLFEWGNSSMCLGGNLQRKVQEDIVFCL